MVLMTTFLLTIFTNLVLAVCVGVALSMFAFVRRMIQTSTLEQQNLESLKKELSEQELLQLSNDVVVYMLHGPFFFGVAEKIEQALEAIHLLPKHIVFRLKNVPFMDMTGLETFHYLIEKLHARGVNVYLCEANHKIIHKLMKVEILPLLTTQKIFDTLAQVLEILKRSPT